MYSEQLEKLIELAIADGALTEKEKQILFKRAEAEGIDLDEFEMVLEARLFEKTKDKTPEPVAAPKSDKFGDVKKCPACGAIIESFSASCADCGFEFRNIEANASINGLFSLLNKIDEEEGNRKRGFFTTQKEVEKSLSKRKASVINNYPVPTTKADIIEFVAQSAPLAKLSLVQKFNPILQLEASLGDNAEMILKNAWRSKLKQIVIKARFSLKNDKKALEEIEHYANELGIK